MPSYRRCFIPGGTYFFTVVTYNRQPILISPESRAIFRYAWEKETARFPFVTDAICLLPDHIHCIWTLPENDVDYGIRWGEIKKWFTLAYHKKVGHIDQPNTSRVSRGEAAIWQRRFWEHTIRDKDDFQRHVDYIHFNPVHHGLVEDAADWHWSSFHRYVKMGLYPTNWGLKGDLRGKESYSE